MEKLQFDDSQWPICKWVLPDSGDMEVVEQLYEQMSQVAQRPGKHVQLVDMRAISPERLTATNRANAAKYEKTMREQYPDKIAANVSIISLDALRGASTAVEWVVGKAPWPTKHFRTEEEGMEWLAQQGIIPGKPIPR